MAIYGLLVNSTEQRTKDYIAYYTPNYIEMKLTIRDLYIGLFEKIIHDSYASRIMLFCLDDCTIDPPYVTFNDLKSSTNSVYNILINDGLINIYVDEKYIFNDNIAFNKVYENERNYQRVINNKKKLEQLYFDITGTCPSPISEMIPNYFTRMKLCIRTYYNDLNYTILSNISL